MDVYARLGIKPIINCATTYTRLGGSLPPPAVVDAMARSARCFVDLFALQAAAGRHLAQITGNEAAYVSNGAAAGLALAAAACITGDDVAKMAKLPNDLSGLKNEIVVHRVQRNWYDFAIRQTGATLVEIGHSMETAPWELDAAITERTAAVFYFAGDHLNHNTLPLPQVVEQAHARSVPVVVDAAAQIPPVSNLRYFTQECGADLAIFSGGKGLNGPQNSGLVVGRADLIRAMTLNGPPNQRIGRPMKVSKDAIVGLVTAVELALERDETADVARWAAQIDAWIAAWQPHLPTGISLARSETNDAGEPVPRVIMTIGPGSPWTRAALIATMREHTPECPAIEVVHHSDGQSIAFNAHLLQNDEASLVEHRLLAIFAAAKRQVAAFVG
jgi:D-glucosaminate-6-phosphate ammonia-lyase